MRERERYRETERQRDRETECVCVCERKRETERQSVCVFVRERETERERERRSTFIGENFEGLRSKTVVVFVASILLLYCTCFQSIFQPETTFVASAPCFLKCCL